MKDVTYLLHQGNKEDYRVISQEGVRHAEITDSPEHNAAWDVNMSPEGKLYFSLCSEHVSHEYAKLCEYDFDKNEIRECFYTKDYLLKQDRYIRDSKFHTSIQFKPDGKLMMITHTTDKSPCHPAWIPYAFYGNVWEGFPGGELIEYDPKTEKVDLLGIPAPRESIYGAVYSPKDDCYYMLGYMRGHIYRYNCKTRKVTDLGQATEYHCYRLALGPDENIYFSTRSGFFMRINVETGKIEDLNIRLPNCRDKYKWPYCYLGPCITGPDGRMYMSGNFSDKLSAFDPKTGKLECIGRMFNEDVYVDNDKQHALVPAMAFDKYGVLWYTLMSFRDNEDEYYKVPSMLMRWDIFGGKKPECLGLLGVPERCFTNSIGIFIDNEKDILYTVSTNHAKDSPDVIAIELEKFRPAMYERGEICRDSLIYAPGCEEYKAFGNLWHNAKAMIKEYSSAFRAEEIIPIRLWRELPAAELSNAAVDGLRWDENGALHGICGNRFCFVIENGALTKLAPLSEQSREYAEWLRDGIPTHGGNDISNLPEYPGRAFRAKERVSCVWNGGRRLVGTEDGILAISGKDGVYGLGPAANQGPIHCLTADEACTVAYGVAGDVEDIGNIFRYDDRNGLRWLGYMAVDKWDDDYGTAASFSLSCCALSPDGKYLAVGAADRLSCVYVCKL